MERLTSSGRSSRPGSPGPRTTRPPTSQTPQSSPTSGWSRATSQTASLTTVTDKDSETTGHTGEGRGKQNEQPTEKLSSIIEVLNERFGLNLTEGCSSSESRPKWPRTSVLRPSLRTTTSTSS